MMGVNEPRPVIVAFVADLMFSTRIEDTAEKLNFQVIWFDDLQKISPQALPVVGRQPAEHLTGSGADLVERLTQINPALILFDLNNRAIPWREWISLISSAPATRRMPVICYGSHVEVDALKAARAAGAKEVLARSRFVEAMPELILKHARVFDLEGLLAACDETLAEKAIEGLLAFNRGDYFEAHELLEAAWNADGSPGRELYRAILQVAVAYLQIERGNFRGALKMFWRVRQWIDPLPGTCRGVNIQKLREDAQQVHRRLLELGAEHMNELDRGLFHPVQYEVVHPRN